jgi:hypothetical protein
VHDDASAFSLSAQLNARAFTVGNDVAFGAGEYKPGTLVGDALIAHELAHVVQQGAASQSSVPMLKGDADYSALEADADRSAVGVVGSLWSRAKGTFADIGRNAAPRLTSGLRLQGCRRTVRQCPPGLQWSVVGLPTATGPVCVCAWRCLPPGVGYSVSGSSGPSQQQLRSYCDPELRDLAGRCPGDPDFVTVDQEYEKRDQGTKVGVGAHMSPLGEQAACGCLPLDIEGDPSGQTQVNAPLLPPGMDITDVLAPAADMAAAAKAKARAKTDPTTGSRIPGKGGDVTEHEAPKQATVPDEHTAPAPPKTLSDTPDLPGPATQKGAQHDTPGVKADENKPATPGPGTQKGTPPGTPDVKSDENKSATPSADVPPGTSKAPAPDEKPADEKGAKPGDTTIAPPANPPVQKAAPQELMSPQQKALADRFDAAETNARNLRNERLLLQGEQRDLANMPSEKYFKGRRQRLEAIAERLQEISVELPAAEKDSGAAEKDLRDSSLSLYQKLSIAGRRGQAYGRVATQAHGIDQVSGQKTNNISVDHLVSIKKISGLPGFDRLSWEDQLAIVNTPRNLVAMDGSANSSKGADSWEDWANAAAFYPDAQVRNAMVAREKEVLKEIQDRIATSRKGK